MANELSLPNAALESLGPFHGDWEIEISSIAADPSAQVRGSASFRWLEGGVFLLLHAQIPDSPFPAETAVIGPDDKAGTYCMLYYDSRGVSRIYQMSLENGIWKLWRDFPGFSQRFEAVIDAGQTLIAGAWEKSTDGSHWEHDFNIRYVKRRSA